METEGNLLQKMKNVFSDNEDKEKIAEEIIEKVLEGYEKGVLTRRVRCRHHLWRWMEMR